MNQLTIYSRKTVFINSFIRGLNMIMNLIKKSIFNFIAGLMSLLFVSSLILNGMLLIKLDESNKQLSILASEVNLKVSELAEVTGKLEIANSKLNSLNNDLILSNFKLQSVNKELNSALVPQKTVTEAVNENIIKPVTQASTDAWKATIEASRKAKAYVFQ